jgi:hypothetical protein
MKICYHHQDNGEKTQQESKTKQAKFRKFKDDWCMIIYDLIETKYLRQCEDNKVNAMK